MEASKERPAPRRLVIMLKMIGAVLLLVGLVAAYYGPQEIYVFSSVS